MWFKFPKDCGGISVEQQSFGVEAVDEDGGNYFRAPDHFAPRILAIAGFSLANPPAGAPEDLPKADPLRDGAIAELTASTESLKNELKDLRSDLVAANAKIIALVSERDALVARVEKLTEENEDLQEKLEDADPGVIPLNVNAKAKAG